MLDYNLNLKSNFDAKSAFKMGSDLAKKGENLLDPKMPRILRYPLAAIDKSQDMLLIRIYNNVTNKPGDDNITTVTDIKDASGNKIRSDVNFRPIKSKSDRFNEPEVGKELEKNARYIYLPIPQQVTDSLTVGYAEDTLNPLQAGVGMGLIDS